MSHEQPITTKMSFPMIHAYALCTVSVATIAQALQAYIDTNERLFKETDEGQYFVNMCNGQNALADIHETCPQEVWSAEI